MTDQECPYAPRHQPMDHGSRCKYCGRQIPVPWYIPRTSDPAQLVGQVAAKWGTNVPWHVAEEIAQALLGYTDSASEVREIVIREAWGEDRYRQHIRETLRWKLFDEVAKQGLIPAGLPVEALRYFASPFYWLDEDRHSTEVPPEAVAAGALYQAVEVTLAVATRTPPVDRAAAVKAGLL